MGGWHSLWRSMVRGVLRVVRRRFGPQAAALAKTAARQTIELAGPFGSLRLDSTAPISGAPPTEANRLLSPLAGRLAGRAVGVAAVLETTGGAQRTHLLTIGPRRR